jgi:hypothetical protein
VKRNLYRTTILTLALVFALTALASCARPEQTQTAAELLDLGEKYLLEMNYSQAAVKFMRAIEVEPKNTRAYIGAADAFVGLGDPARAIEILKAGLDELPGDPDIEAMLDEQEAALAAAPALEPAPAQTAAPAQDMAPTQALAEAATMVSALTQTPEQYATPAPATTMTLSPLPAPRLAATATPKLTSEPTPEPTPTTAPTTVAPTTIAPTTAVPTTEASATSATTTEAPATTTPTVEAPTTAAPATEAPTTEVPTETTAVAPAPGGAPETDAGATVTFTIVSTDTATSVANRLQAAELISGAGGFIDRLIERGLTGELMGGTYELPPSLALDALIDRIIVPR